MEVYNTWTLKEDERKTLLDEQLTPSDLLLLSEKRLEKLIENFSNKGYAEVKKQLSLLKENENEEKKSKEDLNITKGEFSSKSTAEDIVKDLDLSNIVSIVTGGSHGLGLETSKVLASKGATVVIAARKKEQIESAKKLIEEKTGSKKVYALLLDLESFKSIDEFVENVGKLKSFENGFNLLVNNAGVMATPYQLTTEGFEYQFGINYLGHFRLTMKLLPLLRKYNGISRIVNVSSQAHVMGSRVINFDDLFYKKDTKKYDRWGSYAQSKLAMIMFSKSLDKKLREDRVNIMSLSVHPGIIKTGLSKTMSALEGVLLNLTVSFVGKNIPQGASTILLASVHPSSLLHRGSYLDNCKPVNPIEYANDEKFQDQLFELSEKLCDIKYPKLESDKSYIFDEIEAIKYYNPGKNKFGRTTTVEEVVKGKNLKGKVVIVTGTTYGGIGYETARILAKIEAHVIIAGRNKKTNDEALEKIKAENFDAKIQAIPLDLSDFDSIDNFVEEFKKLNKPLNILINNAGVSTNQKETKQGFELMIGVNHIGTFRLTLKLLPLFEKKGEQRVITLTSMAAITRANDWDAQLHFDDLEHKKPKAFANLKVYSHSKLCNLVFSNMLQDLFVKNKLNITSNAVHPGGIKSNLYRDQSWAVNALMSVLISVGGKNTNQGASTTVWAATCENLGGGFYLDDCNIGKPSEYSKNKEVWEKLWVWTEDKAKIKFSDVLKDIKK